jgi:hypothetical protein
LIVLTPTAMTLYGRRFRLPATRIGRQALGWSFIAGGCLSFLPVLGPWMFPVGFAILSVDSARMRRMRRRLTIRIGRKWPRLNAALKPPERRS